MPNLLLKMMRCYTMMAEQTTLRVRERIGHYAPLYVSYQVEGRETIWMQQQLEVVNTVFNCQIDSRAISERFHEMLLHRLNTFSFYFFYRLMTLS